MSNRNLCKIMEYKVPYFAIPKSLDQRQAELYEEGYIAAYKATMRNPEKIRREFEAAEEIAQIQGVNETTRDLSNISTEELARMYAEISAQLNVEYGPLIKATRKGAQITHKDLEIIVNI